MQEHHYYVQWHDEKYLIASGALKPGEDADDAFARILYEQSESIFETLTEISEYIFQADIEVSFIRDLLLILADIGVWIIASKIPEVLENKPINLLYKLDDGALYYGRESTLLFCGIEFVPAA